MQNSQNAERKCLPWRETLQKKQIYLSEFFFSCKPGIEQNFDGRKVDVFFITISIAIPAVQLLTQNINKELQRRVWNAVEHLLQWSFLQKAPSQMFNWALNVRLNWFLMTKLLY